MKKQKLSSKESVDLLIADKTDDLKKLINEIHEKRNINYQRKIIKHVYIELQNIKK